MTHQQIRLILTTLLTLQLIGLLKANFYEKLSWKISVRSHRLFFFDYD